MLTWTCHICKEERPDINISVFVKPLMICGENCGSQNVRYCNDNIECISNVKTFEFVKQDDKKDK